MNIKALVVVIFLSVVAGFGIFFGGLYLSSSEKSPPSQDVAKSNAPTSKPSPTQQSNPEDETPTQTPTPINESSNLTEEIKKLTPRDFSEDYSTLKKDVESL